MVIDWCLICRLHKCTRRTPLMNSPPYLAEHTAGVTTLFLAVPVTVFITKLILEEGPRVPESQVLLLPDGTEASQVKEA
jgi:hypothetical protein